MLILLLQSPHEWAGQCCRRSDPVGEYCHAEQGDHERKRLQKLAVELVAKALNRQPERQRTGEDDATGNRAPQRPTAKDDCGDRDEPSATDD